MIFLCFRFTNQAYADKLSEVLDKKKPNDLDDIFGDDDGKIISSSWKIYKIKYWIINYNNLKRFKLI